MRLSTTTRYGLRALSDLCCRENEAPVSVSDIAQRQDIPVSYLEQLFARLRRGAILESVRGAQGGYRLARPASEITIADVIHALGDSIVFGDCQTENGCAQAPTCPTFGLWRRVKGSVDDILTGTTLEDIVLDEAALPEPDTSDSARQEVRERALKRQRTEQN